jgi:hypothetical protein
VTPNSDPLQKSDHFDGTRFANPGGAAAGQPFTAVPRMLLERRTPWPDRIDTPPQRPAPLDHSAAVVTFIGHATLLIQTPEGNISPTRCIRSARVHST